MSTTEQQGDLERIKAIVEASRNEILAALPKPESRGWKLFVVVLPIVLTSLLGFAVFVMQSSITKKVDLESKTLQARISLTQDYYRERLNVYRAIHDNLVELHEKATPGQRLAVTGLEDSIDTFNHAYATNSLFLTQKLHDRLHGVWQAAVRAVTEDPITPAALNEIAANMDLVDAQMRHDLLIDALDDDTVPGGPPAKTGAASSSN